MPLAHLFYKLDRRILFIVGNGGPDLVDQGFSSSPMIRPRQVVSVIVSSLGGKLVQHSIDRPLLDLNLRYYLGQETK